jgi:hypothetical protein
VQICNLLQILTEAWRHACTVEISLINSDVQFVFGLATFFPNPLVEHAKCHFHLAENSLEGHMSIGNARHKHLAKTLRTRLTLLALSPH